MRNNLIILGLVGIAVFVVLSRNEQVAATGDLDRTRLPIAQPAPTAQPGNHMRTVKAY